MTTAFASGHPPRRIKVALGARAYPILVGPGLLRQPREWIDAVRGRHVLLVTDSHVAPLYGDTVRAALSGREARTFVLPAGEPNKSLAECARAFDLLAGMKASRDACVVALGGGVVGDLAGFVAATWMRGVDFVQMPTTLLAMVDSSVGGKTAVNLTQGKNLIGAFHQPRLVVADTEALATLPDRELAAGLAEVAKYGALGDAGFLDWIDRHALALRTRDPDAIAQAIESACRHKAAIVARDERETGERALLNLGHTFGHAIEAATAYQRFLHGEAVAIGMVLAAKLSARLGMAGEAPARALADLLARLGLPVELPADLDPEVLLGHMRLDKKNASGRLRLILWRGPGKAVIVDDVPEREVLAILAAR
ncbi:MAG: 3-dehydroquinate synthase [Xanthomonadaceae bacterium]|jgi:3-dehydroquinate synthase|nr:3-dehydroquinate synthase [Xanthomonadaceae bacterium]